MSGNAVKKGSYILVVEMESEEKIVVGKLGALRFSRGYYAYVGSAMKGIDIRIGRHIMKNKKKHWHIDYLLERGTIKQAWYIEGEKDECRIASSMENKFESITDFGSSDCRCVSHLFYSESIIGLERAVESVGMKKYDIRPKKK
jgi:Uri superfamily endonuclease